MSALHRTLLRTLLTTLRRIAVVVTAMVLLAAPVAGTVWVSRLDDTLPPVWDQQEPVAVTIDPAAVAEASAIPNYPGAVPVLVYHDLSDETARWLFTEHLATLRAAGFSSVRLTDIERLLRGEPVQLPPKPVLLTFDDGLTSTWRIADPVLAAHGFNAVSFLLTAHIAKAGKAGRYLSPQEIGAMQSSGRWEFGSHTHDQQSVVPARDGHGKAMVSRIVTNGVEESIEQWRTRVGADLRASQDFFRAVLGRPATALSYPYGEIGTDEAIQAALPGLLSEAGIEIAFAFTWSYPGTYNSVGQWSAPDQLPRIRADAMAPQQMLALIRRSMPISPVSDLTALPWTADAASCVTSRTDTGPKLAVSGAGYGTCWLGGSNTSRWVDYVLRFRLVGVSRNSTAVVGVRDVTGTSPRGRIEVVLGGTGVAVRQVVGREPMKVLASQAGGVGSAARDVEVRVQGSQVVVTIAGRAPLAVTADPRIAAGGIRFAAAGTAHKTLTFQAPTLETLGPPAGGG
jgi:peptidoglycan/xylan/chitin deacetylase (PgdA/CDA1 family)